MTTMIDLVKQELAAEKAHIKAGIKQMFDMCEWLEMETSVSFDWRKWVSQYEECPVDDCHELEGNHKALFVQMINLCPDFDVCVQAWNEYSEVSGFYNYDLLITHVEAHGNIRFYGEHETGRHGGRIVALVNLDKHTGISGKLSLEDLSKTPFNGLAVWVDGELDFMYGYPNLGPNGHMVATPEPAK